MHLRPCYFEVGIVEATDGSEVLVMFGEVVVQVPPEMVEPAKG